MGAPNIWTCAQSLANGLKISANVLEITANPQATGKHHTYMLEVQYRTTEARKSHGDVKHAHTHMWECSITTAKAAEDVSIPKTK